MEGVEDAGCVLELAKRWRSCCPLEGIQPPIRTPARKSFPRLASQFSCTVPDLPGTRSNNLAVGWSFPRVRSTMPVSSWATAAAVLVMPHMLINPQHPHACEAGGVIRCGLQARLDMGPHGVPRSCQLPSQSCNGGSLKAQLSDRPADRPCTHTRPGSTHRVVLLNESHDPAGVFAAYPALLKPPEPCRDPGPGRVDHLHHHTPMTLSDSAHNPGSQHSDHRTLCRAPEPVGCEPRSSPYKPTSRSHRSQRSSDTQQQQVG